MEPKAPVSLKKWHKSHMYRATTAPNDPARAYTKPRFNKDAGKPFVRLSDLLPYLA